ARSQFLGMEIEKDGSSSPKGELAKFMIKVKCALDKQDCKFEQLGSVREKLSRILSLSDCINVQNDRSASQKSDSMAKAFREQGNDEFRRKQFGKALDLYSTCVLSATQGMMIILF